MLTLTPTPKIWKHLHLTKVVTMDMPRMIDAVRIKH